MKTAAIVGVALSVAGAATQASSAGNVVYTSVGQIPTINLSISEFDSSTYAVDISASGGFADSLALAFDWGHQGVTPTLDKSSVRAVDPLVDVFNPGRTLNPPSDVCENALKCTERGTNFRNTDAARRDGQNNVPFDYIYEFGKRSSVYTTGGFWNFRVVPDYLNKISFQIGVGENNADLSRGLPFTRLGLRAFSVAEGTSIFSLVGSRFAWPGKATYTLTCTENCNPTSGQNPPTSVPEIDGPVLVQVGFALAGFYSLLLGRRRREDELGQAA